MANVKSHQTPGPYSYGPTSFTDLILGFAGLAVIGVAIYFLFHLPFLLSSVGGLLAGTVTGPWAPAGKFLASVLLGVAGGIIVGTIRLKARSRILDELVAAVVSAETLTAAQVRWSAVALSIAVGVVSGLAVARLGVVGVESGAATVVGPLLTGACLWVCPPGAGGEGDLLLAIAAIAIVIVVLTVLLSLGVAVVFAAAGKGLATGAAQGAGHAIGLAIVLALTRLQTTALTEVGQRGTPGKLTFDAGSADFIATSKAGPDSQERKAIVEPYLAWLRSRRGSGVGTPADVDAYCAQSARRKEHEDQQAKTAGLARKPGEPGWDSQKPQRVARAIARDVAEREVQILRAFVDEVPRKVQTQDPTRRMTATDDAPVFDGTSATLFHPRWLGRSLLTGMREGAIVGAVSGVLSLVVLWFWH